MQLKDAVLYLFCSICAICCAACGSNGSNIDAAALTKQTANTSLTIAEIKQFHSARKPGDLIEEGLNALKDVADCPEQGSMGETSKDAPTATNLSDYQYVYQTVGPANDETGLRELLSQQRIIRIAKGTKFLMIGWQDDVPPVALIRAKSGPQAERQLFLPLAAIVHRHATSNAKVGTDSPSAVGQRDQDTAAALPAPPSGTTSASSSVDSEEPDSAPMKVVRALYRDWKEVSANLSKDSQIARYFNADFFELLQAAGQQREPLDEDPVWCTDADHDGVTLTIKREQETIRGATVEALLDGGVSDSHTVTFKLSNSGGRWKINDIADDGVSVRDKLKHLRSRTTEPVATDERVNVATASFNAQGEAQPQTTAISSADLEPYMKDLQRRIKKHWFPPKGSKFKRVVVIFTVSSDGALSDLRIDGSSGVATADSAALKAVEDAAPFRPLPAGAPESVPVTFTFDYNSFR